jgi:DNA-binding MarR family transcriptional regulator
VLVPGDDSDEAVIHLAHDLRIACMRVSRRVRFETPSQVAPHQFSVLARLSEQRHTAGELAAIERVSPPSMSRTVAGLADRGLVTRSEDPDDGRVVQLSLSVDGERVLRSERAQRDAWMAARIEALSRRDREILARATEILGRVVAP